MAPSTHSLFSQMALLPIVCFHLRKTNLGAGPIKKSFQNAGASSCAGEVGNLRSL